MNSAVGQNTGARLIVRAGRQRFALAARSVREIVKMPRLTRVPLAPPALIGLGSVRGETLAVLALSRLVSDGRVTQAEEGAARRLLVLDGPARAAVAVDAIERLDHARADAAGSDHFATLEIDHLVAEAFPLRGASRRAVSTLPVEKETASEASAAFLQVAIGTQAFALPLAAVVEVIRMPGDIAVLPGADAAAVGSAAWRGTALGVLSLAVLLGLPAGAESAGTARRIVVVELGGSRFGILVERVDAILQAAPERIDPVPASLANSESEARISAIYRPLGSGLLVSILAADQLLSEARTRNLLADFDAAASEAALSPAKGAGQFALLPVAIGAEDLAFPLSAIREVTARPSRITRLPGAPDWLAGMAMVGGAPVAVVDQVFRLTGHAATGKRQRLLVVEAGNLRVGFLVTGTGRIVHCDPASLAPAPLPEGLADGIFGNVLQLSGEDGAEPDRPLLMIDPAALVSSAERALIARFAAARAPSKS